LFGELSDHKAARDYFSGSAAIRTFHELGPGNSPRTEIVWRFARSSSGERKKRNRDPSNGRFVMIGQKVGVTYCAFGRISAGPLVTSPAIASRPCVRRSGSPGQRGLMKRAFEDFVVPQRITAARTGLFQPVDRHRERYFFNFLQHFFAASQAEPGPSKPFRIFLRGERRFTVLF